MSIKSCSVKVICLASLVCLSVSPVALFYMCSTLIRGYLTTAHYVQTTCTITGTNVTSTGTLFTPATTHVVNTTDRNGTIARNNTCVCRTDNGTCVSQQACVQLMVRYHSLDKNEGVHIPNALLFENYQQRRKLSKDNETSCSYYMCLQTKTTTPEGVLPKGYDIIDPQDENKSNENFTCYVDPGNGRHVLKNVPQKQDVFTGLFWPLLGVFIGLCFCVAAKLCTREKD